MTRILLVDDETIILNVLSYYFKACGWDVVAISDSAQAAEILNSNETFDIMVSDIRMTPINGMELLKLSREVRPAMPVILMTGFGSNETFKQATDLGAFCCLQKPFGPEFLLKTIEEAFKTSKQ